MFLLKNNTQNLYIGLIPKENNNDYYAVLVNQEQATKFHSPIIAYDIGISYVDKKYENDEYEVVGESESDFDKFIEEENEYQYQLYLDGCKDDNVEPEYSKEEYAKFLDECREAEMLETAWYE